MLTYETSTELLLKDLFYLGILFLIVITYIGVKLMAAFDDAVSNLTILVNNSSVVAAFVKSLQQPQGGATEAQVQAIADGIKAANNTVVAGVPGTTVILDAQPTP